MNGQISAKNADLVAKIARLVEQRGWNQEDFCRQAVSCSATAACCAMLP
jgi:hypothetical protein